jgi:hypothetical protein
MSEKHWSEIAAAAEQALDAVDRGQKEETLKHEAKTSGKQIKTLWMYLAAWRFVKPLAVSDRSKALKLPVASLEVLARWNEYDGAKVLQILRGYDPEKHSVRKLRKQEQAARSPEKSATPKRQYCEYVKNHIFEFEEVWPYKSQLFASFRKEIEYSKDEGLVVDFKPQLVKDNPSGKADFLMRMRVGRDPEVVVAVLIVGPYTSGYLYQGRASDWCLRALGLATFHQPVVLILPRGADPRNYIKFLEKVPDTFVRTAPNLDSRIVLMAEPNPEQTNERPRPRWRGIKRAS